MDVRGGTGQGGIFSKPFAGVESIGKFAGETGQGVDEGLQNSTCKGLYPKHGLAEKAQLFSFHLLGSNSCGPAQLRRQT